MVAHADGHSNPPTRPAEVRPFGDGACPPARSRAVTTGLASPKQAAKPPAKAGDLLCHSTALQSIQLYSRRMGRGGGREALVRQRKPLRQLARRLIRRLTVKRHHRGRHARARGATAHATGC